MAVRLLIQAFEDQGLTAICLLMHPLTAYALANVIEARPLSLCAKCNLVPNATEFVYSPMLRANPIDSRCGPALQAEWASGASLGDEDGAEKRKQNK